ncbi:MAG: response regulator [Planctomycetota bacterium]|nr:response regulator [Planctomycetota bacterium]
MNARKRILAVDDEPDVLDLLAIILESDGHEVVKARDAAQAMEAMREQSFDLITLDLCMPETGGDELQQMLSGTFGYGRRVSTKLPHKLPPILVITGMEDEEAIERLLLGERVVGVLQKPMRFRDLLRITRDLFDWEDYKRSRHDLPVATRTPERVS